MRQQAPARLGERLADLPEALVGSPAAMGLVLLVTAALAVRVTPVGAGVAVCWPGVAAAVGAVATSTGRRRRTIVVVIAVAALLGNVLGGRPPVPSLAFAVAAVAEAVVIGVWVSRSGPPLLRTMGDLAGLLVATVTGALLAGAVVAAGLVLTGTPDAWPAWHFVATSHAAAVLMLLPLVMRLPGRLDPVGRREPFALWSAVLVVTAGVFGVGDGALPLAFLSVAVLAWSASRLGARVAAAQLLAVGVLVSVLTTVGSGPFARAGAAAAGPGAAALVQLFLAASSLVVLVLAVSTAQRTAAIRKLAEQRRFERAVLEVVDAAILACDADGTIVVRNSAHRRLTGVADGEQVDPDALAARLDVRAADGTEIPPERSPLLRALAGEHLADLAMWIGPAGSRLHEVVTVARPIQGEDGGLLGAVAAATDVTAEREAQNRLRENVAFRDAVLAASPDLIYIATVSRKAIIWASRDPAGMFGHPPDDAVGHDRGVDDAVIVRFVHPDDLDRLRRSDASAGRLEDGQVLSLRYRVRGADDRYSWFARRVTPFRRDADGRVTEVLGVVRDITDVVGTEERLAVAAQHDPMTGLPNRRLLTERLDAALTAATGDGPQVVVLFCDLDGFKNVNDTSGHAVGDAVLIALSARIASVLRPDDTIARVGGDEFVILLAPPVRGSPSGTVRARAREVARRVTGALARPVEVDGVGYAVTVSVGIAFGRTGDTPQDVLRDADSAMYRAKALGKDQHSVFDETLRADVTERRHVQRVLREALQEGPGTLSVAYQPLIDLGTQRLVGVEALARLTDAEGRTITPDVFIPLAEDNGLIAPLGRRVLDRACADLATWHARHPAWRGLGVSVNLSARQADLTDLAGEVRDALTRTGLAASLLTVELTETMLVEAGHATLAALHRLRELGVKIAIDDFGTGYAGLAHLSQLPITGLKIDKSFTAGLPDDPTSVTIVAMIAGLARDLGLSCVAEGIETDEHLLALPAGLIGQGWFAGSPGAGRRDRHATWRPIVRSAVTMTS